MLKTHKIADSLQRAVDHMTRQAKERIRVTIGRTGASNPIYAYDVAGWLLKDAGWNFANDSLTDRTLFLMSEYGIELWQRFQLQEWNDNGRGFAEIRELILTGELDY